MDMIDLRSDTVTHPTPAMREAMANAPVGDDVYGEDPMVNQLERDAAAMLGKEAGLFVASGTMGNLTAVLTHCGRGDEMIVGRQSHIVRYEAGGSAALGGVMSAQLEVQRDGTLDLDAIRAAVRGVDHHYPTSRLICLENTHGGAHGAPLTPEYTAAVGAIAKEHGLKLHIDGARIFNAAAALNVPITAVTGPADSITFCLSKGLCAPVGSVLVGSAEFIFKARTIRKSLGGGMRQAGILAAAGLIALHEMTQRLHEDHANARRLAEGLANVPYIHVDLERVKSNMVFFDLAADAPLSGDALGQILAEHYGILLRPYRAGDRMFRAVAHYYITEKAVETVLDAIRIILTERVPN